MIYEAVVVGAGISGLVLGQRLRRAGRTYLILDKGKSVGGRMATRRDGSARFDHGAQFIHSQLPDVFVGFNWNLWLEESGKCKYVSPSGMNSAAKNAAQSLNLKLNAKVISLIEGEVISLILEDNTVIQTKKVFMTAPLPQTLDILKVSKVSFPEALEQIKYTKALVGLFQLKSENTEIINFKYSEQISDSFFSIANQSSKEVSSSLAFTVTMSPTLSDLFFDQDEAVIQEKINEKFILFLRDNLGANNDDFSIEGLQIKKWRYCQPLESVGEDFAAAGTHDNIFITGDSFRGGGLVKTIYTAMKVPV